MHWRTIQKNNFHSIKELAKFLEIDPSALSSKPRFSLNVPVRLAKKIEKGTLDDPILRQFIPLREEEKQTLGFVTDPVEDASFCKTSKLLQKYAGRALILTTSACAMHCRFCFRQNFDYDPKPSFEKELELIGEDASLHEVILSGGDPLSLSDSVLTKLLEDLSSIPHVQIIRFHTRFPIGIPERITEDFCNALAKSTKQITFVLHVNHPKELDCDVLKSLKLVQRLGIPILTQTVLLRGVNDDLETLKDLYLTSIANGIVPYYLHQLDKVAGTAHMEVSMEEGQNLIENLRQELPGYGVPLFVQEIPEQKNKTPLTTSVVTTSVGEF